MPLQPGDRLGPYQIVAVIGSGAMGDVYRARDTRLNRIVAIKVSKQQFSERFEREAVAVAALNSPHVCQLYDVGPNYLVMEFVDGTPLQPVERPDKLLDIATQIADGLMAAHAAGIIHRDLKPANIHITADGQVKILDFGLAIGDAKSAGASDVTAAAGITHAGTTVGTIAYMSPEQARGRDIDTRSDLWALGVTLYELATGVRPFDGPTTAVIFEGILNRSPVPVQERNPAIPAEIARIIDRLLDKDRETRYQSAADVRADLKRAGRGTTSTAVTAPVADRGPSTAVAIDVQVSANRKRTARRFAIMTAIALTSVAAAVAYLYFPRSPVTSPSEYVQVTNFTDSATAPVLSPDGRMVAFIRGGDYFLSSGQIYVKLLPNGDAIRLTDTPVPKLAPAFTADGSRVAYTLLDVKRNPVSWDTWAVPVYGGDATQLLPNAAGLVWLDEQRVMFSEMKPPGIHMGIVTSTEGRADHREIYFPAHERAMAHYSWASPDRKTVLVVEMDRTAAWQRCRLVPFDGSSPGQPIGPAGTCIAAGWSPDGKWMYFNAQVGGSFHLWRQRFPDGTPQQITFGPSEEEGLAVAPDGKSLITSVGLRRSSVWIHDLQGERALLSEGFTFAPLLSRDAKRLYYLARQTSTSPAELWIQDLTSGRTERLLPGLSVVDFDVSLDETLVAYTTRPAGGESQIWLASLDRRSAPRRVVNGADRVSFGARDELLMRGLGDKSNSLERIKRDGSGRERIGSYVVLDKMRASPDGEWVAASVSTSDEAGNNETLVIPVHGGSPVRICAQFCPVGWSTDGKFFHVNVEGRSSTQDVTLGQTMVFPLAPGRALPELPANTLLARRSHLHYRASQRIDRSGIVLGPNASTYVYVRADLQRNLFRIPLH